MANVFLGLNQGADYSPDNVQEGSSTNSTDVEVRIAVPPTSGANWPKGELVIALQKIIEAIEDGRFTYLTTT